MWKEFGSEKVAFFIKFETGELASVCSEIKIHVYIDIYIYVYIYTHFLLALIVKKDVVFDLLLGMTSTQRDPQSIADLTHSETVEITVARCFRFFLTKTQGIKRAANHLFIQKCHNMDKGKCTIKQHFRQPFSFDPRFRQKSILVIIFSKT